MQVALPLPQPVGYMVADEYKLQFSFDGESPAAATWVRREGRAVVQRRQRRRR